VDRDEARPAHPHSAELRSFGRRRGRKLSPRQTQLMSDLLPRLSFDLEEPAPERVESLFAVPASEVWLEIGFGGSEHLIWQAKRHPDVGLIGCEPFEDGVVKALTAIDEGALGNVRLWADDVRPLLRWLPEASISRVFMLFPDPWPKKRHNKRRLFSLDLLHMLARVMKPGAEFRLATDIADYARTSLMAVSQAPVFRWTAAGPQDWREQPADWPQTRYQAKAGREGRHCYFFRFVRV
jgi:tRNA (guanine-N7-)-methyltransferase